MQIPRYDKVLILLVAIHVGAAILLLAIPVVSWWALGIYDDLRVPRPEVSVIFALDPGQSSNLGGDGIEIEIPTAVTESETVQGVTSRALERMRSLPIPATLPNTFVVRPSSIGKMQLSLLGLDDTDSEQWQVKVNGRRAPQRIGLVHVEPGDKIRWFYGDATK